MDEPQILVQVIDADLAPEQLEEVAYGLRDELYAMGAEDVQPLSAGEAPAGTRGLDVAAVGAWLVTIQTAGGMIGRMVSVLRGWLDRAPQGRELEITVGENKLVLKDASDEQQTMLIAAFVDKVQAASDADRATS